jgi:hypothetical protein
MPHTRRVETTLAALSLVAGLAANFTGFILIGRLAWPLSLAFLVLGTVGVVGAVFLIAAADRNPNKRFPPSVTPSGS